MGKNLVRVVAVGLLTDDDVLNGGTSSGSGCRVMLPGDTTVRTFLIRQYR